jgi:hypothetical protein
VTEWPVGKWRVVLPFLEAVDHAALQLFERKYRRFIVDELAHKQVAELIDTVLALQRIDVKQGAPFGECVLDGDNLSPLAVRTGDAFRERGVTDIDIDALALV